MKRNLKSIRKRVTQYDEYGDLEYIGKVDEEGLKQGWGTFCEPGLQIDGIFKDDELEGSVKFWFDDGSYAHTSMKRGEASGEYSRFNKEGRLLFSGNYEDGKWEGKGK